MDISVPLDPTVLRIAAAGRAADEKATIIITGEDLEDAVSHYAYTEQDEFNSLIWNIRQEALAIPQGMVYGRFQLICNELLVATQHLGFRDLPFLHTMEYTLARQTISQIPAEYILFLSNLIVLKIESSADDIIASVSNSSKTSVVNVKRSCYRIHTVTGELITLSIDCFKVVSCIPSDLEYILRLKLAEQPHLSPRQVLYLIDRLTPLRVIPGCSTITALKAELERHQPAIHLHW